MAVCYNGLMEYKEVPGFPAYRINDKGRLQTRWTWGPHYSGYTFPDKWTRKAGISKLRIYVQGTNLFTWTDYSGYNPEVNKRSTDALRPGEDYCSYPLSRTFSVGVNFNL